jgi:hypothetical protein
MYEVPHVYRLSPTHSWHIYRFSCIRCLVYTVYPQHTRVVLSVSGSNSSNQFQLIATDTPNPFNIASPSDSNEASSLTFCRHPHYLSRLICFELFVIITLSPLSRQGIEIIPYKALPRVNWNALTRRQASKSKVLHGSSLPCSNTKIPEGNRHAHTCARLYDRGSYNDPRLGSLQLRWGNPRAVDGRRHRSDHRLSKTPFVEE